ncbi:M14 family zinc carboxypeptidase [Streptomyces sp. NPDC059070]|uniref:M14 family zinc carboxypeptidase n=1 Tax=Streptomyces sp. NPDC059070 TaxID=3346713 RepID=UPI0036C34F36
MAVLAGGLALLAGSLAAAPPSASGEPRDDFSLTRYYDLNTINALLDHLVEIHPGTVLLQVYGRSFEGRPLQALSVTERHPGDRAKPGLLVVCGQSARAWISPMACLGLASAIPSDPAWAALLKRFRVDIVPMANPDGFVYSWTTNRLWRKTRTDNNDLLCPGVDPNRNWDSGFGGAGSSADKCSEIYHGTAPFSISETRSLKNYVLHHHYVAALDVDAYGQQILLPAATSQIASPVPHFQRMLTRATRMATAMHAVHGTAFAAGNYNELLYEAGGTLMDWLHFTADVPNAYTVNLRDAGDFGFILPADQIQPSVEEFNAGVASLMNDIATDKP